MNVVLICFTAIWLMPAYNTYGTWPASGEIDLVESRGNRAMTQHGVHIGTQVILLTDYLYPRDILT